MHRKSFFDKRNQGANTNEVQGSPGVGENDTSGISVAEEQHIRINESLSQKRAQLLSSQNSVANKSMINNDK